MTPELQRLQKKSVEDLFYTPDGHKYPSRTEDNLLEKIEQNVADYAKSQEDSNFINPISSMFEPPQDENDFFRKYVRKLNSNLERPKVYIDFEPLNKSYKRYKRECNLNTNINGTSISQDRCTNNSVVKNETILNGALKDDLTVRNVRSTKLTGPVKVGHVERSNYCSNNTGANKNCNVSINTVKLCDPSVEEDKNSLNKYFLATISRDLRQNPISKNYLDRSRISSDSPFENFDIYSTSDPFKIENLQVQAPEVSKVKKSGNYKSFQNLLDNEKLIDDKCTKPFSDEDLSDYKESLIRLAFPSGSMKSASELSEQKIDINNCALNEEGNLTYRLSKLPSSVYHLLVGRFVDSSTEPDASLIYSRVVKKGNNTKLLPEKKVSKPLGKTQRKKPKSKLVFAQKAKINKANPKNNTRLRSRPKSVLNRDFIRTIKCGNCVCYKNNKMKPIKSVDKFVYPNGTIITGNALVKKANFSVSKLVEMMDPSSGKPGLKKVSSVLKKRPLNKIRVPGRNSLTTAIPEVTPNFLLKLIDFMGLKSAEITTERSNNYFTVAIGKQIYYNISKDMPLIGKKQEFELSNGTIILGEELLKKTNFKVEKIKELLSADKKTTVYSEYLSSITSSTEKVTYSTAEDNIFYIQSEVVTEAVSESSVMESSSEIPTSDTNDLDAPISIASEGVSTEEFMAVEYIPAKNNTTPAELFDESNPENDNTSPADSFYEEISPNDNTSPADSFYEEISANDNTSPADSFDDKDDENTLPDTKGVQKEKATSEIPATTEAVTEIVDENLEIDNTAEGSLNYNDNYVAEIISTEAETVVSTSMSNEVDIDVDNENENNLLDESFDNSIEAEINDMDMENGTALSPQNLSAELSIPEDTDKSNKSVSLLEMITQDVPIVSNEEADNLPITNNILPETTAYSSEFPPAVTENEQLTEGDLPSTSILSFDEPLLNDDSVGKENPITTSTIAEEIIPSEPQDLSEIQETAENLPAVDLMQAEADTLPYTDSTEITDVNSFIAEATSTFLTNLLNTTSQPEIVKPADDTLSLQNLTQQSIQAAYPSLPNPDLSSYFNQMTQYPGRPLMDSAPPVIPLSPPGYPDPGEIPAIQQYMTYPNGTLAFSPSNYFYPYAQNNPFSRGFQYERNPSDYYYINMMRQLYPHLYGYGGTLAQPPFNFTSFPIPPAFNMINPNLFNQNPQLRHPPYFQPSMFFNYSGGMNSNENPFNIFPNIAMLPNLNNQPNLAFFTQTSNYNGNNGSSMNLVNGTFGSSSAAMLPDQKQSTPWTSDSTVKFLSQTTPSLYENLAEPILNDTNLFTYMFKTVDDTLTSTILPLSLTDNATNEIITESETINATVNNITYEIDEITTFRIETTTLQLKDNMTKPIEFDTEVEITSSIPRSTEDNLRSDSVEDIESELATEDYLVDVPEISLKETNQIGTILVTEMADVSISRTDLYVKIQPPKKSKIGTLTTGKPSNSFQYTTFFQLEKTSTNFTKPATPSENIEDDFYFSTESSDGNQAISLGDSPENQISVSEKASSIVDIVTDGLLSDKPDLEISDESQIEELVTQPSEVTQEGNDNAIKNEITSLFSSDENESVTEAFKEVSTNKINMNLSFDEWNIFPLIMVESDSVRPTTENDDSLYVDEDSTQENQDSVSGKNDGNVQDVSRNVTGSNLRHPSKGNIPWSTTNDLLNTNTEETNTVESKLASESVPRTQLRVPLVLSEDMKTVWTLSDYIKLARRNNTIRRQNVTYYIYDGCTPLAAKKKIYFADGSSALQGNLIKDASYSYPKFLKIINSKADLKVNTEPNIPSDEQLKVTVLLRPITGGLRGSNLAPYQFATCVYMTKSGHKVTFYPECLGGSPQPNDKLLIEKILLPSPGNSKFDLINDFESKQHQAETNIVRIGSKSALLNGKSSSQSKNFVFPSRTSHPQVDIPDYDSQELILPSTDHDELASKYSAFSDNIELIESTTFVYDSYDEDISSSGSMISLGSHNKKYPVPPEKKTLNIPNQISKKFPDDYDKLPLTPSSLNRVTNSNEENRPITGEPEIPIDFIESYDLTITTVKNNLNPNRHKYRPQWMSSTINVNPFYGNQHVNPSTTFNKDFNLVNKKNPGINKPKFILRTTGKSEEYDDFEYTTPFTLNINRINPGHKKRPVTFQSGFSPDINFQNRGLIRMGHKKRPHKIELLNVKDKYWNGISSFRSKEYTRKGQHRKHGRKKHPIIDRPGTKLGAEEWFNNGDRSISSFFNGTSRLKSVSEKLTPLLITTDSIYDEEPDYEYTNLDDDDMSVTPPFQHGQIMNDEKLLDSMTTKIRRIHPITQGHPIIQVKGEEWNMYFDDKFPTTPEYKVRGESLAHANHKSYNPNSPFMLNLADAYNNSLPTIVKNKGRKLHPVQKTNKKINKNTLQPLQSISSLQKSMKPTKRPKHAKAYHRNRHLVPTNEETTENGKQWKKLDPLEVED